MTRVISALAGIPLVLAVIFLPGRDTFRWIVTALALLSAWEYLGICRLRGVMAAAVLAGTAITVGSASSEKIILSSGTALLLLLAASLWKVTDAEKAFRTTGEAVLGMAYISYAFTCLFLMRDVSRGARWVLILLFIIWIGDTAAYYGGRRYGKRRLSPLISPKKTWEGTACGLLGSVAAGTFTTLLFIGSVPLGRVAVLSLLVGVSGQVGDLIESLWKRAKNVKDSGRLLPGHGGILDRIDGLLLGVPVGYQLITGWVIAP